MKRMLDKAKQEKLNVSIMTTYLREDAIDAMRDRLELLYAWCETNRTPVEVVANDWGTLVLLTKKRPWLIPSMGVLLNKRRKDPRMKYKTGFADEEGTLAENSLNEAFYRDYLKETYGLTHFEQEACGYRIVPPKGHNRLHVPYELGRYDVWGMRYSFCENDAAYPKNGQNMTIMQSHEVCGGEQEIAPQDNEGDEETYEDDYLTGATGCGLCALYDLADAGITHLKLVGRGNFSEYMKLDILKTRKALEILEEMRGAGRDAYRKEMRAVLFTGRCSQNCYYR